MKMSDNTFYRATMLVFILLVSAINYLAYTSKDWVWFDMGLFILVSLIVVLFFTWNLKDKKL